MHGSPSGIGFTVYDPADERRREALLALGNGWLLVRGCAVDAAADGRHYPGTYRAGCYDRLTGEAEGERFPIETLVNLPNWLLLRFRPEGETEWFSLDRARVLDYRHSVDFERGIACREARCADGLDRPFGSARSASSAWPSRKWRLFALRSVPRIGRAGSKSAPVSTAPSKTQTSGGICAIPTGI